MRSKNWNTSDIPPQQGKFVVVTGTGGLGYETARALAGAGADVVLAGRNQEKGAASIARIKADFPHSLIRFAELDLCNLASISAFGHRLADTQGRVDILVNNAGVMSIPNRRLTSDGFEVQFGTNYLGHFALTGTLLPMLRAAQQSRVANVSSLAHRSGKIHFADPQWALKYKPWGAYSQSKLAMLMFSLELQRRSDAGHWGILCTAAHPGFARTDLAANSSDGTGKRFLERVSESLAPFISHSAAEGALPTLFAAAASDAVPAGYYGPAGFLELKGPVARAQVAKHAKDKVVAAKLWDLSQELTARPFPD